MSPDHARHFMSAIREQNRRTDLGRFECSKDHQIDRTSTHVRHHVSGHVVHHVCGTTCPCAVPALLVPGATATPCVRKQVALRSAFTTRNNTQRNRTAPGPCCRQVKDVEHAEHESPQLANACDGSRSLLFLMPLMMRSLPLIERKRTANLGT